MNIKNNIINYLYDRENVVCMYDNFIYIYDFKYLDSFSSAKIIVKLKEKEISIMGNDLSIVRITKEELLIKGTIKSLEVSNE
jgi:sporulation protein YqfC